MNPLVILFTFTFMCMIDDTLSSNNLTTIIVGGNATTSIGYNIIEATTSASSISSPSTNSAALLLSTTTTTTAPNTTTIFNAEQLTNDLIEEICKPICYSQNNTGVECYDSYVIKEYCLPPNGTDALNCEYGIASRADSYYYYYHYNEFGQSMWDLWYQYVYLLPQSLSCIKASNYSVPSSFVNIHCTNYVRYRWYYGLGYSLTPWMYASESFAMSKTFTQSGGTSMMLVFYTPLAIISTIFGWFVLKKVEKLNKGISSIGILKTEVIVQLLSFFSSTYLGWNGLELSYFLFVPFCFMSPYIATGFNTLRNAIAAINTSICDVPLPLFLAIIKLFLTIERYIAIRRPVYYRAHITKEWVRKIFIRITLAYITFVVIVFSIIIIFTWDANAPQTQIIIDSSGAPRPAYKWFCIFGYFSFFVISLPIVIILQLIFASLLSIHLILKKNIAKNDNETRRQRKAAFLILSTLIVNLVTYAFHIARGVYYSWDYYILPGYSLQKNAILNSMVNCGVPVADLGSFFCIVLQCACSTMYFEAVKQLWVSFRSKFCKCCTSTNQVKSTVQTTFQETSKRVEQLAEQEDPSGAKNVAVNPPGAANIAAALNPHEVIES